MLKKALNNALNLYDEIDWIIIANKDGIIEYSTLYDTESREFKNENTAGMHVLDVYPQLRKEKSSILRVLKTGKPIFYEQQMLHDFRGNLYNLVNTTVPIIESGDIIGAIEVSKFIKNQDMNVNGSEKSNYSLKDIITRDPVMLEIKEKESHKPNRLFLSQEKQGPEKNWLHNHSINIA